VIVREVGALIEKLAGHRLRVPAMLAPFTGMRLGEILAGRANACRQAVTYRNSQAFKDLDPLRNKAIKIVPQYTVEAEN